MIYIKEKVSTYSNWELYKGRHWLEENTHRLNMELDLQSLFGLLYTPVLIGWDPATPRLPPHLGSYTRALLVSQDRRHLFVTPMKIPGGPETGSRENPRDAHRVDPRPACGRWGGSRWSSSRGPGRPPGPPAARTTPCCWASRCPGNKKKLTMEQECFNHFKQCI